MRRHFTEHLAIVLQSGTKRLGLLTEEGAVSRMRTRLPMMELSLRGRGLAREHLPLREGRRASFLEGLAIDEVAFEIEVVGDVGVDGCELL